MDKYELQNNTYSKIPKDNPKDRIAVEIGDAKQVDFFPQVKHQRWDNECNVSYRLIHEELNPTVTEKDGKINWKGKDIEVDFYELTEDEGGYEMEVILHKKPKTNIVSFTLQDKDVDYFYQPALTEQEIKDGYERPDNVIGSYAVYAKIPKTNWTGGKEYKCGKVGHIYRPKIIDSGGKEVWGDLHIEDGILSVTIPQEFLDSAIYPVKHAAGLTFGFITAGGSDDPLVWNNPSADGSVFPLSETGTLKSITAWIKQSFNDSYDLRYAVYDSDKNLVEETNMIEGSGTDTIEQLIHLLSNPSKNSGNYWIIATANSASEERVLDLKYDSGDIDQGLDAGADYTGGFPSSYSGVSNTHKNSIYVTYTASTGSIISPLPTFYQ